MMEYFARCKPHLNKIIFSTKEMAAIFIEAGLVGRNFGVYPCPEVKGHFHVRDNTKKHLKEKLKRQR